MELCMLDVQELGSGEAIVLLGSTWSPADYVLPLARVFATRFRVLVPSFPGYDGSPVYPGTWTSDLERQLLEEALLARGAADIRAVIGSSLGGYRALALACGGRVHVGCAVSLAGVANLSPEERAGLRGMGAAVRAGRLPFSFAAAAFSPAYAAAHPEVGREVDGWAHRVDWRAIAAEYDAISESPNLLPELANLRVPVLARVGELDAVLAPAHSEAIAHAARRGTLERVPGAGHLLLLEGAEATTRSILAFVERAGELSG